MSKHLLEFCPECGANLGKKSVSRNIMIEGLRLCTICPVCASKFIITIDDEGHIFVVVEDDETA